MDINFVLQNSYVQLAVILSGLLTLGIILINGFRYIIVPVYLITVKGYRVYKKTTKAEFDRDVLRSISDQSYFISIILLRMIRLINNLASLIMAVAITIYANFLYIPGYRERMSSLIVIDMSPNAVNITGSVMLFFSVVFMFAAVTSSMRFALRVRKVIADKLPKE